MSLYAAGALLLAVGMTVAMGLKIFKDHDISRRDGATIAALSWILAYGLIAPNKVPNIITVGCTALLLLGLSANIASKVSRRMGERLPKR